MIVPSRAHRVRLLVAATALAFVAFLSRGTSPALADGAAGPYLLDGNVRNVNGRVLVEVITAYGTPNAYDGFIVHLRWDPTKFRFASADPTGGLFDPNASPATGFCLAPDTTTFDSDGGGVVFACVGFGYSGTTAVGHLVTIALTPVASGCSRIHVLRYGGADGGDDLSGSYTMNAADITPQVNHYNMWDPSACT